MRILVVEDDEMLRTMLQNILEDEGYEVLTAANGEKALKVLGGNEIGIVITDIIMPFKEGVEVIIECRRKWEGVKIVAISGGGRAAVDDFLEIARKFGADSVLKKPFKPDELIATIRRLAA